jgi:hypothetical protein
MVENDHKILVLEELFKSRARKQKELDFYNQKLVELQNEMRYIQMDIDVTNIIINMIREENVIDLQKYIEQRDAKETEEV